MDLKSSSRKKKSSSVFADGVLNQVMSKLNKSRQLRDYQHDQEAKKRNSLLMGSSYRKINKIRYKYIQTGSAKNLHTSRSRDINLYKNRKHTPSMISLLKQSQIQDNYGFD